MYNEPNKNIDFVNEDSLLKEVLRLFITTKMASVSLVQRRLGLGYDRASKIVDLLEEAGYIGPLEGAIPRKIFITKEMFYSLFREEI